MRQFAKMGLAVAAAALAAPALSLAGQPEFPTTYYGGPTAAVAPGASTAAPAYAAAPVAPAYAPVAPAYAVAPAAPAPAVHNHDHSTAAASTRFRILPSKRKTPEQQRQELMAKGVYVPPMPSTPPTGAMVSEGSVAGCSTCQQNAMLVSGPMEGQVFASSGEAPGRAIVGGGMPDMSSSAGEPTPIGVMRTNYSPNSASPMAEAPGRAVVGGAGPVPAKGAMGHEFAPSGYGKPNSPRVLQHLFGLPTTNDFRALRARMGDKTRERHAMQALGEEGPVNSLPPSAVYGPR